MLTHPAPHKDMLLPYMHPNLSQILRTWTASVLLSGAVSLPSMTLSSDRSRPISSVSELASLTSWDQPPLSQCFSAVAELRSHYSTYAAPTSPIHEQTQKPVNISTTNQLSNQGGTSRRANVIWPSQISRAPRQKQASALNATSRSVNTKPKRLLPGQQRISKYFTKPHPDATDNQKHQPTSRKVLWKTCNRRSLQRPKQKSSTTTTLDPQLRPRFSPKQIPSNIDLSTTWGHALEDIDISDTFRVILQNPNGFKPYAHNLDLTYSLQTCASLGTGILSLMSETYANWNLLHNHFNIRRNLKSIWRQSAFQTSLCSETFTSNYQPGGTATMAFNTWTCRIIQRGEDPFGLGRWSYITLRGAKDKKITVVTGYRVCNTTTNTAGVKTALMQQCRGISKQQREDGIVDTPQPHRNSSWTCRHGLNT
jgi:hypothetical protein